jgi:hypothetical protein
MDSRMVLYYLSALAGIVMIVGGIWLIYKEKIYLDHESKEPIEIQSPLGSFKSNYPALTLFVLGFFPLVYPIYAVNNLTDYIKVDTVRIRGAVAANAYPVVVYAARAQDSLSRDGEFQVPVPFLSQQDDYRILLVVNDHVLDEARVERNKNDGDVIEVKFKPVVVEPNPYQGEVSPIPAEFK